jgi:hypothetical protein
MKYILVLIFTAHIGLIYAQNLVPNYSFEKIETCTPPEGGYFQNCLPWAPLGPYATPDYYNECISSLTSISVPSNFAGYQFARTGKGYAGLACFASKFANVREYLNVPLKDSLKAGAEYCISFYSSLADDQYFSSNCLGLLITDTVPIPIPPNKFLINITPQIDYVSSFTLNDSIHWTGICGTYIARGGEKYITIGCFRPDTEVVVDTFPNYQNSGPANKYFSYYYIDDVFVLQCSDTTAAVEEISRNKDVLGTNIPNPFSTSTMIPYNLHSKQSAILIVTDILGRKILEYELSSLNSSIEIDMKDAKNGIYFYKMIVDGKMVGIRRMMVVR